MDKNKILETKIFASKARIEVLNMLASLGNGHVGGCLSVCDVLAVLYCDEMKYRAKEPSWSGRDYLVMSKGHCGPALYATLALKGFFPMDELYTLNRSGTRLPSHCDRNKTPGIDMSTGSLGQGVSCALGMALGLKASGKDNYVYSIIGDGETQEGQVWETMIIGANKGADNLLVFLDYNKQQLDGYLNTVSDMPDIKAKADSFGWHTEEVNGHDVEEISNAIDKCKASKKPGFIILNTVKGKGWKQIEGLQNNHAMKGLTGELVASAIAELKEGIAALEQQLIKEA